MMPSAAAAAAAATAAAAAAVAASDAAVGSGVSGATTPGAGGGAPASTAAPPTAAARSSPRFRGGGPAGGLVSSRPEDTDTWVCTTSSVGDVCHDTTVGDHVARRLPPADDPRSQIEDGPRHGRVAAAVASSAGSDGFSPRVSARRGGDRPPLGVARGGVARRVSSGVYNGRGVVSRGRGRGGRGRSGGAERRGREGERGDVGVSDTADDGALVRGVMVTIEERLFIVGKWAEEVAFRVAADASSARPLQLHLNHIMSDVLKADLDGQGATAAAASTAAETLRSLAVVQPGGLSGAPAGASAGPPPSGTMDPASTSPAGVVDAGTEHADARPMSLATIGRDTLALCRVVKAAQELYRAAELVRGLTGTTGDQVESGVADLVFKKARDWNGSTLQAERILKFADATMPYVGNTRRSGVRVSGALPAAPAMAPVAATAADNGAGGAAAADAGTGGVMFEDMWDMLGQHGGDGEEVESGGEEDGAREEGPVAGRATSTPSDADGGPAARPARVEVPAVGGGAMTAPAGGRRSTLSALQQAPLEVSPGGASGRSGRDGHAGAAAAQADKAMADI